MTDTNDSRTSAAASPMPSPTIKKQSGPSLVWIIPLVTLLVGGWLIAKTLSEKGPRITISFKTAEGIEAGKTKIKYKNVEVGKITGVRFSEDFSHVILTADFAKGSEPFLRRNTRFWVIRPRLSLRGISGLGTLVSGAYIEIEPGQGVERTHFVGLEKPPVVQADEAGKRIVLMSSELGSVDTGSPVYYQGITAGEVLGFELGNDRKSVFIHAFIKSPYDELVHANTRFWNVSGMHVSMDADGFKLDTQSVKSMMFGGIAFDTVGTPELANDQNETLVFTLFRNRDEIGDQAFTRKIRFVMFFDGSVRGLSLQAPVEFKGIQVGEVVDIHLEYDSRDTSFRIPVVVELEPERIVERGQDSQPTSYKTLNALIQRGLRARLKTGSLLTGQLFVELDMHPGTEIDLAGGELPYPELPTIPGSLDAIAASVEKFAEKLERVEIDKIGMELLETLQGVNKLTNSPALHSAVQDLEATIRSLKHILRKVDDSNLVPAIDAAHVTLEKINGTLMLLDDNVLQSDSPLQHSVIRMTTELEETARSIRSLVDMLERSPESFIFGKNPVGEK